ncbi:MAG: efflux RND transporter permease subunit [Bacteroidota bacterium]
MKKLPSIDSIREFFMSSWAIDNRITTYVLTVLVTLVGVWSFNAIPKENFPEITVPLIYIGTPYPGNSPENIEQNVTYHIEKELKSIEGVKEIKSQSIQDFSVIIVEFETSVDIPEAKKEVKDAVDRAQSNLPDDAEDPRVEDINLSEIPIMFVNISSTLPPDILKNYAEQLQDEIEQLSEIRRADLLGVQEKEVQINLDLYKMQAAGLAFGDIENAIGQRDVLISGGSVNIGDLEYTLQVEGKFKTVEQIGEVTVRNSRGLPIKLRDVAEVKMAFEDQDSYARLDGLPTVSLNVIKKAGENLVSSSNKIKDLIEDFQTNRIPTELQDDFNIKISADQSYLTKNMLKELTNTIVIGFILVTIVLMFFMGIRDSMFVGLSVPLSSMIAFVVLPWIGFTLNLVVLFTFIFALGIVVDNAIVVIENTHRIYNENKKVSIGKAAKKAAGEVIAPVFAGTLTTMAPFIPLTFWDGIIGEFMFFLPITIIITLLASLLVAYVINPVFAVSFMRRDEETNNLSLRGFAIVLIIIAAFAGLLYLSEMTTGGNVLMIFGILFALYRFGLAPLIKLFQNRFLPWIMGVYRRILRWSLVSWRPYAILASTVFLLIFSFFVIGANPPKIVFFPEADPNFIYVYTQLETGTDIEKTNEVTQALENKVYAILGRDNPVVKSIITNIAKGAGSPADFNQSGVYPNKSRIQIEFVPFKDRNGVSTVDYLEEIRDAMEYPGAVITVEKEASGPPTAKPINIEISGENFPQIIGVADSLRKFLRSKNIAGVEELKWDLEEKKPELEVRVDEVKASEIGMNMAQIGLAVRTAVYGAEVSKFREGEDEYPIMLRLSDRFRNESDVQNMQINYRDMSTGLFHSVPIRSVADIQAKSSYGGINRLDLEKAVTISSNVLSEFNPNEVVAKVQTEISGWMKDNKAKLSGVTIDMTGEQEEQAETSAFLGTAMGVALLLIFLILVAQFNSMPKVFIIFSQIIFSITGVFLGFGFSGMDLSIVMVGVGLVSLAGIVVNNGIILLDFIELMKKRGMGTRKAIIEGGATRFTPVLLTASSTVLGLLPLGVALNIDFGTFFSELDPQIFFGGDNAAFWGPLSWTIIYGLGFATIVTLVVVPVMYYVFYVNILVGTRRGKRLAKRLSGFLTA